MPGNPWDNDPVIGAASTDTAPDALGRLVIRKGASPQGKVIKDNYLVDPNSGTATPIQGLPAADDSKLSPEALDAETTNWILTGKMSPLGMGNGPLRVQIENNRPVIMKKYGISDNGLPAIQKQFDADSKAYSQRTQQISLMNQALDAAKQHVEQIGGYLKQLPAQTSLTPLNAISNEIQRAGSGETITQLDATIPLLQGEVAKIMTANPSSGAGQLTDEARREFDILNSSRSPTARQQAMDAIMEMVNRKITGTQAESDRLQQRLNGGLQSYAIGGAAGQPPQPPAAPTLGGTPPSAPPENPIANGGPGDMGPSLSPSGGQTRSVIDPKKQALGQQIVGLVQKGADPNTIMGFATGADPTLRSDPKFKAWVAQAIQYRQQHPNAKFPIDPGFYTTEVPLSATEKLGNTVAQSAPGAALMNAADASTAGNLGNITGDRQGVDRALAVANAQHPLASLAGTGGGAVLATAGIGKLLGGLGVAPEIGAPASDAAYGAIAGASNNDNPVEGAGLGALLGLAGGRAGNLAAKGAGAALEGVTSPTVSYVDKQIPGSMTLGQAVSQSGRVGQTVKKVEDSLSGIRIVGDAINARRTEGLQKMNSAAFDKALEPIGGKINGKFGEEAVQDAQQAVSDAYTKALSGKAANVDMPFIAAGAEAKQALDKLPDTAAAEVEKLVDGVMQDHFDKSGQLSGENLQSALRELQNIKASYSGTPAGNRIGKVIDQFSDSLEGLFQRQAPEVMPQYNAAKKAAQRLYTLNDAVLRAKNTNGLFTPGQLGMADRASTINYGGKAKAAAGGGEFHDFQRAMQNVLPNQVPDSGTAGRVLVPLALLGLAGGGGALDGETGKGLTLGAMLAAMYSKTGQKALTAAVLKRGAGAKAAGQAVRNAAPLLGHAAAGQAVQGATRD